MIKTRIFQFVGHIHNMQLCIEMISFINHENESILRWFYRFCEPRNFSLCPRNLVGVYSGGLGVWFMTFCCCLVEFGSSCFNHAWIESWFVWFGPWYSTQAMSTHCTLSNPSGPCLFSPFHLSYVCAFRPLVATCPIRMQQRKKINDLDNLRAPFYRHVPIQHPAETSLDTLVLLEESALLSTLDHFLTLRAGVCTLPGPIFDLWPSAFIGHTELMKWWGDTMSFKAGDETRRNSPIHVALEIH